AAREDVVVAEWLGRVDEDEVEIARDAAMLEGIIENENVRVLDLHGGGETIGGDANFCAGHFREQCCFITAAVAGAIAAEEDCGSFSAFLQLAREPRNKGGFAGSAGGYVADADGGFRQTLDADAGVVFVISG